jgi:hypothetical protein
VDDVTLVTLSLSSPDPTHVRIENRLDGPVWPPREQGVPAAGWDETGFSGVVDGSLALGYACPAVPDDGPAAELVEQRPPTDDDGPTARSLVRELGDASPPPAAVGPATQPGANGSDPSPPPAVTAWLDSVSERLARADRLAEATSVTEAADAVDAAGGAEEVRALRDRLAADREALATVADRCRALADDAETVEIPVETLARLA